MVGAAVATIVASRAATKRESFGGIQYLDFPSRGWGRCRVREGRTNSAVKMANIWSLLLGLVSVDVSTSWVVDVLSRIWSEDVPGGVVCLDCMSISMSRCMIKESTKV